MNEENNLVIGNNINLEGQDIRMKQIEEQRLKKTNMLNDSLKVYAKSVKPRLKNFTEKEHQVLDGIWQGHSNLDIARDMRITVKTVKFHINNIHKKLGVVSRLEALAVLVAMLVEEK